MRRNERLRALARVAAMVCGYWLLALLLAWRAGALDGAWGADSDEASHFLNGVMVLDYAKAGFPGHPLRYAENYYRHYPKIGLGHWPPLFALVEAAWFVAMPLSYVSGIVLVNLLAAGVAAMICWMGRYGLGLPSGLAWGAGFVWLLLPLVRQYSAVFMAEMLLTFCVTAAVMAFARESIAFGWWAGLALLTKGTAIALAPLPALAALLGGGWGLLRKRWIWVSAGLVLVLAAAWYLKAPGARHERVAPYGGPRFLPRRGPETLRAVGENLGPALALAALAGVAAAWRKRRENRLLLALLAFLPAHVGLRMLVAAWETRHLVMVFPALLLLAAYGLQGRGWRRRALLALVAGATLWHLRSLWPPRPATEGFTEAAAELGGARRILVAGTVPAEGALICSVALRDGGRRPWRVVERGTKVLMESDFLGWRERMLVRDAAEVGQVLRAKGVDGVVVDRQGEKAYVPLVQQYMEEAGGEWERRGVYGARAEVWVRKGHNAHKGPKGHN